MLKGNLLREPMIRAVTRGEGLRQLSLPEIFAACAADRIETFPALRPHQVPAWHAFLVQIAVMGCEALELEAPPGDEPGAWLQVLRALTPDWPDDEPWTLVTPHDKPAFFQPPVPERSLDDFKKIIATPDGLDMLVTSKNHDVKAERMMAPHLDDWIFALVSLQTQEGQMGAGNYGIARMNGGYSSRPYMWLQRAGGFGQAIFRSIGAMLRAGNAWDPPGHIGTRGALPLVWLDPWDGIEQLNLADLHPLFVECCRRVRMLVIGDGLICRVAGSDKARIPAKELKGALGDPWAPIDITEGSAKALSVTREGFSYRKSVELLFPGGKHCYEKPFLARRHGQERGVDMQFELAALARGQGKTEGFHTRSVAAPGEVVDLVEDNNGDLASLALQRVGEAGAAWGKAVRPALIVLFQGGREETNWKDNALNQMVDTWRNAFDARVDAVFFPALWEGLKLDQDGAANAWALRLRKIAQSVFIEAKAAAPQRTERRFIAEARAEDLLDAALRKALPSLKAKVSEDNDQ